MLTRVRKLLDETDRPVAAAVTIAGVVLVVVLAVVLLGTTWRSAVVLRDAVSPPADLSAAVVEDTVTTDTGLTARLYRPAGVEGPLPAFVLVHGAIGQGPDDPRLVDLSRALAARGATVMAPTLDALARFRLDVDDPSRIADAAEWLAGRSDLTEGEQVAIFGISIGGSYGLLAATEERAAPHVSAVMVFGGYHDLAELLTQWLTDPVDIPTVLDPFREGRRLVLLGNVERAVDAEDVATVTECLQALLDGSDCGDVGQVGERAALVIEAARSEVALDPADAAGLLESLTVETGALSPSRMTVAPSMPVYLLHAVGDPVVPTTDTEAVAATLEGLGARVSVHITDAFEHVDADQLPPLNESWPLVRFVARFLDDAGM